MKKLRETIIQVSVEEFRQHVDELLEHIKNGVTVVISENGHTLATVEPAIIHGVDSNVVNSKDEALQRLQRIGEALRKGELSVKDSLVFSLPPIDMGKTDSGNLDDEIYR